jgi:hypothetical protein
MIRRGGKAFLEGIEWTGADIAIDHPDSADGQRPEGGRGRVPVVCAPR